MSNREQRRKGVVSVSSQADFQKSASNSLDWDSPSTKTGTVKRRPNSSYQPAAIPDRIAREDQSVKGRLKSELAFSETDAAASLGEDVGKCGKYRKRLPPKEKRHRIGSGSGKFGVADGDKGADSGGSGERGNSAKAGKVSDSDSGIASPLSPGSVYGFLGYADKDDDGRRKKRSWERRSEDDGNSGWECCCAAERIRIYTDWANHYLEKAKSKKRVSSLATDCSDGVLLAEVIESVTCQKIPEINRKPKSPSQMLDNVNLCLSTLRGQHVAGVEGVSAQELRDGKLNAILALFFALSRHKQAAKAKAGQHHQQQQQQTAAATDMTPNRSSAIPHKGGSSIPLPGSAIPARRCAPDKVRPVASSSRSSSPALSMIPRGPPGTVQPASPYQAQQKNNSVLDKLKLFKSSENRGGQAATATANDKPGDGKRTSSSSGVSSARSDSSASLEPSLELRPVRNASRLKQGRPSGKPAQPKGSPNAAKRGETAVAGGGRGSKTAADVEKHATKVASLAATKLAEPKTKATVLSKAPSPAIPQPAAPPGTGIPKPTAAVKGTSKAPPRAVGVSREGSQVSLKQHKPAVALVSPMKNEAQPLVLSESSHSASTGHHSNSSESSVIYRPSSESGSEPHNIIPNRHEPPTYLTSVTDHPPAPPKQQQPLTDIREGSSSIAAGEDPALIAVEPMKPLLRGYCGAAALTLPSRQRQRLQRARPEVGGGGGGGECCEAALAGGYLSDGEVLRGVAVPVVVDVGDGYVSEGGAALYARRVQGVNGSSRHPTSLTVLTEQSTRRGGSRESPPPPPTPRVTSKSSRNGMPLQDSKHMHQQWKRYTDSPGVGSPPPPPPPAPTSPPASRRERRASPHHGGGKEKGGGGSGKGARGVPQSFGYVKRNGNGVNGVGGNGANNNGQGGQVIPNPSAGKTAAVSAVPRTKVKVSGGTQTCSSDLQQSHKASPPQFKSYSLTGNTANQLSQSVRERLMMGSQSLPKGVTHHHDYGLVMRQARPKVSDGSLSDTQAIENTSPYAPWLRHSNTYSVAPRLTETDSMESLTSLPGHRSSLTHTRLMRDSPSRLSRSNSIRSTKSEKLYPSMLHRSNDPEAEPYYCLPIGSLSHWSQPTSPAPGSARTFPLSPTHSATPRHSIPKNDDVHGSSVSLVSTASSLYSSAEEKQAHEIRKLRRELVEAQEKVYTLTSQLSTNAHVVSAFEQSLTSMTQRLQHLTATSEKKESELQELRQAMESLRAQSIQAGIGTGLARQPSSDSVSSLSSACSLDKHEKKKKKGWLRSSFTKAFSRNAKVTKVQCQSDNGESERTHSPPPQPATDAGQEVVELQKQLREKDLVLTDIRLEALSSAHQLESLKDTVMKMRSEMLSLKQNNERLQRMVGGSTNLPADLTDTRSVSSIDALSDLMQTEEPPPEGETDGKRIAISVYLGQPQSFEKYYVEHYGYDGLSENANTEISIAYTTIGASSSWAQLDNAVRRAFKQYVARLDPGGGLGLGSDAIASYKLGEAVRTPEDAGPPDLLPVGYAVGRVAAVHVVLQPVAALAFEALIPKGVAQRLVSLLAEHRRLVLCGAPGTGKTHLATRLAEFHAQSLGRDPAEAVATFNVDNKSSKELRQYLQHLSERSAAGDAALLPCVVVLDDLHRAAAGGLAEALGSLPRNLPCLLGTMAQSACSATSLQLQHGFRWVLVAPHMEPARGLLGRVLRRRLAALELVEGPRPELAAVLGWLPRVWQHLNAFLETHSSGDVAIGPRLFLGCPLDLDAARAWFADVWNYSLAPYLREAAREGLQLYGRRAPWTDPAQFVVDTYPWPGAPPHGLAAIPAADVGLEAVGGGRAAGGGGGGGRADGEGDPLLSMLMRLQEAANYSSPHSNDSDCNSLDSNMTHGSNIGQESVS